MRVRSLLATSSVVAFAATVASAKPVMAKRMMPEDFVSPAVGFQLQGRPIGGTKPATATPAYLTASRIAAVGDGALVIDADSGALVKTDAAGKKLAELAIGGNAGLLAYDPATKLAYVADRVGNRVAIVKIGDTLELQSSIKTPVEPYGVALSPDRKTVMVTTIADRALVAYDTASGKEKWRTALGREPRGIAVAPDGSRALVAYLATGMVDQIDLLEAHGAEHVALSTASASSRRCRGCGNTSEAFARGAFAVTFMGEHEAVVPFQRETPVQISGGGGERTGSYGGGFEPPITHELAFMSIGTERHQQTIASIGTHQPHALAWDPAHDSLYVAGLGNDNIVQIKNASQIGIAEGLAVSATHGKNKCGPEGVAIAHDGHVLVWCSFTRTVERLDFDSDPKRPQSLDRVAAGPTLVGSSMTDKQHRGMLLFASAAPQVSQGGAMACQSCHPDGRTDGLSWRIEKAELQTPLLSGRMVGTHPFKWDGGDKDLRASLATTMKRLGGSGLSKDENDALAAYLEALPAPRAPSRDGIAVARGKKLFDSAELGCRSCHDGTNYTDQEKHKFAGSSLTEADTPSLVGLAASAPYYHDGSAVTLEALLRDRGNVHGMAETAKLSERQVADLTAFLETL